MASPTPHLAKLHGATFWDSAPAVLQLLETELCLGFFLSYPRKQHIATESTSILKLRRYPSLTSQQPTSVDPLDCMT